MEKAKEKARTRPSMIGMAAALMILGPGCSGLSGLRSVGMGKPSLFGLWDRSAPPSPSPENDYYAQRMHESGIPGGADAPKDKPGTGPAATNNGSTTEPKPLADGSAASTPTRQGRSTDTRAAESVRVTLGRPEPLPGLLLAANVRDEPAASDSSHDWKDGASRTETAQDPVLTPPRDGDLEPAAPPDRIADTETREHRVDPKVVLAQAESRLRSLSAYQVKFSRSERVGGQLQPEEEIVLSVQREPKAIRLEWTNGANKGREVIYARDIDPRMIFVHLPSTTIPLPSLRIPVDSPLVMKNSRHAITEAGFETIVANLQSADGGNDRNQKDGGTVEYKGLEPPPGSAQPAHHFVRRARNGETWNVYFDARSMMPSLVQAVDSQGTLVERYLYRAVRENPAELASAGAFEPDKRWGESKNLLSRIARAAAGPNLPANSESTTR
jgi:hypothetical protein